VILAGIGSIWFAQSASQTADFFGGGSDGGVFVASLIGALLPALVVLLPYFILSQTMEALADVLDHVEPDPGARPTRGAKRAPSAIETFVKGTETLQPEPIPPAELSVDARRVAGALGALGGATYEGIAAKLDMDVYNVDAPIRELQEAGLVTRGPGGLYRYSEADDKAAETRQMVPYCETCGWVITATEAVTDHAGHRVGRRKRV
jgi:hypothetical protein